MEDLSPPLKPVDFAGVTRFPDKSNTRGVDVGTKEEIHRLIRRFADDGKGIMLISSDLPEILALSHRIIVMHEGDRVAELTHAEATEEAVLKHAIGLGAGLN